MPGKSLGKDTEGRICKRAVLQRRKEEPIKYTLGMSKRLHGALNEEYEVMNDESKLYELRT